MALFSKEYYLKTEQNMISDFSIETEFKKLKKDSSVSIICEGFGTTKVIDKNHQCYVEYLGKEITFEELTGIILRKI